MHILITNDDGIHAPGIKHLWNALKSNANVTVVAPMFEQSAVGLSITIRNPLQIEKVEWSQHESGTVWGISGTPADCIKLGLHAILKQRPDLVVSGINRGANSGRNVLYSGTIAAAIESVFQGIPAIAFSCSDYDDPDYCNAAKQIPAILQHVAKHPLPAETLLNVNFPEKGLGEVKGFKMASQGKQYWVENPNRRTHPSEGHSYYWLGSKIKVAEEDEDSDIAWLKRGYVTAVPVHVGNLTDYAHLESVREHFDRRFP